MEGKQCTAARALLGWKQPDLSKAISEAGGALSVNSIMAFERGGAIRQSNADMIQQVLEAAGVIFIEQDKRGGVGVRLAKDNEGKDDD